MNNWAIYNCTCTWSTSTCNDSFIYKLSEISDYPRLLVTCTSLTVCLLCIYLAHGRQTFIAVFNNMRTLKFKAQLTIGFSLPSIIIMEKANEPWITETNKMDRNLPITTERHDLLTRLKWTSSVSREVCLDDWRQQKT